MTQNDFFVAIQGIMSSALEAGWTPDQVEQQVLAASEEWVEETVGEESDPDDEE